MLQPFSKRRIAAATVLVERSHARGRSADSVLRDSRCDERYHPSYRGDRSRSTASHLSLPLALLTQR